MDDIIGQAAWNKMAIGSGRQCSATSKQSGERCKRAPIVGGFVCDIHGGKIPAVRQSARERLLAMVDPALDALLRALQTGPPCEHCGRSDADRDPVVLRAAQLVLDRSGFHPTLTVEQAAPPNPYEDCTEDELIEKLEKLLKQCYESRDFQRAHSLPEATDAVLLDAFVVPEDEPPAPARNEPIQNDEQRNPFGNSTDEKSTSVEDEPK